VVIEDLQGSIPTGGGDEELYKSEAHRAGKTRGRGGEDEAGEAAADGAGAGALIDCEWWGIFGGSAILGRPSLR